jgi:hypothetical protein
MTGAGFPHSEILESQPGCRLLEAYRRLQRPSSAPGTKTSTVCPYKLDTRHYMQKSAENRRCSRPLCSSQDTDGTMPQGPPSGRPVRRPFESAPIESGCFLRTQQCAHPATRSGARSARRRGGGVLAARSRASWMNSQCSTRKHGRPGERMPPEGAGAP